MVHKIHKAMQEQDQATSYLLHWRIITWLKEHGYRYYDLRGYEPEKYPGVSQFKAGLSGEDVRFMGTYETYEYMISLIVVRFGEFSDIAPSVR